MKVVAEVASLALSGAGMTARAEPASLSRDPLVWCWVLTGAFFGLMLHRLSIPSKFYFDEVHYVPAARNLLELSDARNKEHPMVGKELLAAAMWAFGDNSFGWRIGSAVATAIAFFASLRATWWASLSRTGTVLAGIFLASNFMLFMIGRIGMLDAYMLAFTMLGLWFSARAVRRPGHGRLDLALTGVAFGMALGSKWSVGPVIATVGLAFAVLRWCALPGRRGEVLTATDAGPVRGVSLIEAGVWLGLVPVAVYLLTFIPLGWYATNGVPFSQVVAFQGKMLELQQSVVKPHPYMSHWWQWVVDWRPIWFLYEEIDGAQRGVLMLGNPFTMLAGLPALAACAVWGWLRRDPAMLAAAILYLASLGMWIVAPKPVQFYYHYLLPAQFLGIALALVLAALWDKGGRWRWPGALSVLVALALFAWFYPIISAAKLPGKDAYLTYTWLHSWR